MPKDLRLNKTNKSKEFGAIFKLDLSINNGIISSKIYDKRDDFDFAIVNYSHLDGDVSQTSKGLKVYNLSVLLGSVPL